MITFEYKKASFSHVCMYLFLTLAYIYGIVDNISGRIFLYYVSPVET